MKVCIVGGGPSALFFAILITSKGIAEEILILEQNPKDATYGFGVALADSAIDKLAAAEPDTLNGLQEKMHFITEQVIENNTGEFKVEFNTHSGAITRLDILTVMEKRCAELGIEVHHGERIENLSAYDDYDLIVGADGANSIVRSSDEAGFGTQRETRGNYFVWWGCEHPKHESGLRFRSYKNGSLIIHYYAYTPSMWTVVGEVDEQSWYDLGMDKMDNAQRKAIFEREFGDVLQEHPILENKSNWNQFTAITNENWSVGNRVLLGDALFRAHFSIGSGTRLAMEDALGLANALEANPDNVAGALAAFEEDGKRRKERLIQATRASYTWYETAHTKLDMPILEFIRDFMDRTGRMPEERLRMFAPNFMAAWDEQAA